MNPHFQTVVVANTALCLGLALGIALGLGRRLSSDGSLAAWVRALLLFGLIGPLCVLAPGLWGSGLARDLAFVAYALALGLQADAIARLGGAQLSGAMRVLPAVVLTISLLTAWGDPATSQLLRQQMSGMLLFAVAGLALFLPERIDWRVRVAIALPNALLGATYLGMALGDAVSVFSQAPSNTISAADAWLGVLGYAVLLATTLALVVAELARADRQAREAAQRDGLTGLFERRTWLKHADRLRARAARRREAVLLAIYGIEDLSGIVRREGRIAADRALAVLGHTLLAETGRHRMPGRINGELLAFIESSADPAQVRASLEGWRARAENAATHELGFAVRVSVGAVECAPEADIQALLAAADRERREGGGAEWAGALPAFS